ncbi:MAG: HEAT repeat domain-containing protein [Gemmatimonadaceae bacterium]|nr:HEAT repeat domain-containing protein [Gemmatimonadaceae bacterium]
MDSSCAFARHFAHLVWLFLNEREAHDAQLATLHAAVAASREGEVTLSTRDWQLLVNGAPASEAVAEAQDLTAQLIGHAVTELRVAQRASPAELLLAARLLAREPEPGDGGYQVVTALRLFDAQTIAVKVEAPPSAPQAAHRGAQGAASALPGMISDTSIFAAAGAAAAADDRDGDTADGGDALVHEQDPEHMFRSFSATETPKGSMVKLFEQLDAARTAQAALHQLDALVALAAESAQKARLDIVADVLYGLVEREAKMEDRTIKRQMGIAVRRLWTPSVLRCVAELLPRRRENHEQYMTILTRAEDAGVEALVEALISAPSIGDRRVYYDALLRLRTGVRTLVHMLGDPRWYVVRNAAELLGELRVAEADEELTALLSHPDDRVRAAAAAALAKLGSTSAVKGVRGMLREAPAELRELAADALATNRASSVEALIRAYDRETDQNVQLAILAALGQLGTPEAVKKLAEIASTDRRFFKSRPTPMRVAAVHALGEVRSSGALAALQALLRDKEKAVRGAASWVMMGRKQRASGAVPRQQEDE